MNESDQPRKALYLSPSDLARVEMAVFDQLGPEFKYLLREYPGNISAVDVVKFSAVHGVAQTISQIRCQNLGYFPPVAPPTYPRPRGEPRRPKRNIV